MHVQAIKAFSMAIELKPLHALDYRGRSLAYRALNHIEQAMQYHIITLMLDAAVVRNISGTSLKKTG